MEGSGVQECAAESSTRAEGACYPHDPESPSACLKIAQMRKPFDLGRARTRLSALTGRPQPMAESLRRAGGGRWRTMILTSIHDIDAARWDALVGPGAVTRSHAYLAAVEASGIEDCRYFYPVVFDADNDIVAHACIYLVTTDFRQLLPRCLQPAVKWIRHLWPGFLRARLTECGSPMVAGHSLSIHPEVSTAEMVGRIADAAMDIAWSLGSSLVLVRDFTPEDVAAGSPAALAARGFNRVWNMPLARISVRWRSYEEYLAALKPRYRKDLLRRLRRGRVAGFRVETQGDFAAQAERWLAQAEVVRARNTRFDREALTSDYYREMDVRLGEASFLLVAVREGEPAAHGMVITDADNTIATFFGRAESAPDGEWFLLMDEVIRIAIARGSQAIHLGLGSHAAKGLVGAEAVPLRIYCRSRHALLNWLMRRMPDVVNRAVPRLPSVFSA